MLRSPLLPIFLTVFVDVMGLTLMLPLLPLYSMRFIDNAQVATTLISSYAACQLVSGPILGRMSDRIGRKPVLLVSQAGTFIAFLLIGSAGNLGEAAASLFSGGGDAVARARHIGLALLFAGRMIDGMTAGNLSIAQAYISDVTKPENRTRAFALIGIAFGSGFFFGPMISGELSNAFRGADGPSFAAPAYLAAALSMLSIVLSATLLPGQAELEKIKATHGDAPGPMPPAGERTLDFRRFLTRPLPRLRLLQFFAFTTSFAVITGGLALYLAKRFGAEPRQVGWVYGVSGFVGAMVQGGGIRPLVKRMGEARLARLGFLSMIVAYPFLGLVHTFPTLLFCVAFGSFGVAVIRPCLTTLLTKSVGRHEQGAALGTNQSFSSISQIIGPGIAGFLIQHDWLGAYGIAAAVAALAGAVLSFQPEPQIEPPLADSV
jgi:MFS family permease